MNKYKHTFTQGTCKCGRCVFETKRAHDWLESRQATIRLALGLLVVFGFSVAGISFGMAGDVKRCTSPSPLCREKGEDEYSCDVGGPIRRESKPGKSKN